MRTTKAIRTNIKTLTNVDLELCLILKLASLLLNCGEIFFFDILDWLIGLLNCCFLGFYCSKKEKLKQLPMNLNQKKESQINLIPIHKD